jgi:thiosulfate reductase cytochrome b subunit
VSEDGSRGRPITVRRGLPRQPGETTPGPVATAINEAAPRAGTKVQSDAVAAPTAPAAPLGRRAGLPRTADPAPAATTVVDSAGAPAATASSTTTAPAPGRRAGLSRAGGTPAAANAEEAAGAAAKGAAEESAASPAPAARVQTRAGDATSGAGKTCFGQEMALDYYPLCSWPVAAMAAVVLGARWFVSLDFMQDFLTTYPGETHLPAGAPAGLPAWLGWQHFLNAFFILLIIKTGWQVRTQKRPPATWVRNNEGFIRTKNPPTKISLTLWAHLSFDALWVINGIVFIIVLFATGQWMRVVPTSWDVIPNAVSAALQYLSLDWPTENGWVNYNSLQLVAYFLTIFVAAPLAAITGIRMSGAWPIRATRLNKLYPVELARAIHFPVMLYFVLFVITHVTLVLATGALRNLNHMYAAQDSRKLGRVLDLLRFPRLDGGRSVRRTPARAGTDRPAHRKARALTSSVGVSPRGQLQLGLSISRTSDPHRQH